MKMPTVNLPASKPSPIGNEISINVDKFKDLKKFEVGEAVSITLSAVVVGQHMHNIGKKKEHMYDVKISDIMEIEGAEEEEEEESEEESEEGEEE